MLIVVFLGVLFHTVYLLVFIVTKISLAMYFIPLLILLLVYTLILALLYNDPTAYLQTVIYVNFIAILLMLISLKFIGIRKIYFDLLVSIMKRRY